MTSSVSGNDIGRSCFRILMMSCDLWSADVHGRTAPSKVVVTRVVTHIQAHGSGGSCPTASLLGLGQYRVDASLIFCQAATPGRWPGRPGPRDGPAPGAGRVRGSGHGSLVLGVGVPCCLPDSPGEVFELISRDVEPDPSVRVDPHLALVPAETHLMAELPEPRVLDRVVLPRARPAAGDGDLQLDKPLAGLVDGADPGNGAGIVAEAIRGVDHAVYSA